MMTNLVKLVRPKEPIRESADVSMLAVAMEHLGYTASPEDIQWAYSELCEEKMAATWVSVSRHVSFAIAKEIVAKLVKEDSR